MPSVRASQALRRARARANPVELLPGKEKAGPHGDAFWTRVAEGVPGRTAEDCLDGFLASGLAVVGRFAAQGPEAPAPARSFRASLSPDPSRPHSARSAP